MKQIVLVRGEHSFIFNFDEDHLEELGDALHEAMKNPYLNFDFIDGLVLSQQADYLVDHE